MPGGVFTVLTAILALLVARCASIQKHGLRALLGGAVGGIAGIGLVAMLSPLTGLTLELNRFTCAVAAVLGVPGTVLLLVLKQLLK